MDVPMLPATTDSSISYFNIAPELFPWRELNEIETRRVHMTDQFIFDILLQSGGVRNPELLFPPRDMEELERLLTAIHNSTYDVLKKNCLIYLLLKWFQDGRDDKFREEKCIPPQFVALADAYWYLDTGINVERAVAILSDSRLNRDYASKILQALALSENSTPLILKYIRTAKPLLVEPDDLGLYITALTETNLLDAWQFQRTFPENRETRLRLIRKIFEWCLSPKPRLQPLKQLMAFPFSDYEQAVVHEYALHPPPSCPPASIPVIQDLACVRLIQSGQYTSAIKLDRRFSQAATNATGKMKNAMQDRRRMMDELIATMPMIERNMLDMELNEVEQGTSQFSSSVIRHAEPVTAGIDVNDLSMSWEYVSPTRPVVNGYSTPPGNQNQDRPAVNGSAPPLIPINLSATPASQSRLAAFATSVSHPRTTSTQNIPWTPSSAVASSGLKYPLASSAVPNIFTPTARAAVASPSLFNSAESANRRRNAFYEPPPVNGVKRLFHQDDLPAEPQPVQLPDQPQPNPDDRMDTEANSDAGNHHDNLRSDTVDDVFEQHPFSLFADSGAPSRRITRTETQMKMPPGAFFSDSDDEEEVKTNTRSKERQQRGVSQSRKTRSSQAQVYPTRSTRRRLPGALMDEEEDDDDVPPLPPPVLKRPVRKGRSRANSHDDNSEQPIQPRRSSRLSASSVISPSPEPPSPPGTILKPRKSSRTSAAGATARSKSKKR